MTDSWRDRVGLSAVVRRTPELVTQSEAVRKLAHLVVLAGAHERDTHARPSRPSGATDPVHVGVVVARRVEIDHVRNTGYVDPASCHVGGHQHIHSPRLKARERLLALALRLVAVNRQRLDTARG
jgi:hypothetical protein